MARLVVRWSLLPALVIIASCDSGPSRNAVKGTVLFEKQPAEGVTVVLQPVDEKNKAKPSGVTDANGVFELSTYPHGKGAPAGDYYAVMTWYPLDARENAKAKNKLPDRWGDASLKLIPVTIKPGPNQLEPFVLTK